MQRWAYTHLNTVFGQPYYHTVSWQLNVVQWRTEQPSMKLPAQQTLQIGIFYTDSNYSAKQIDSLVVSGLFNYVFINYKFYVSSVVFLVNANASEASLPPS